MSSMAPKDEVDVLIVGAGPAGLTCALALTRAGVRVRIIDQSPHRVTAGHADGVMPRTSEILQSYGLGDILLQNANHVHAMSNYNYDATTGDIKFSSRVPLINEPTARYMFSATHHQGFIEGMFTDALRAAGVPVERPFRPTSLEVSSDEGELRDPTAYPIKVVIKRIVDTGSGEEEIIRARFLVGADGAHSWVRRMLNISMEGQSTAHAWGGMDFTPSAESNFPDWRNITTINSKDAVMMLIPREDDKIRLYIELGPEQGLVDPHTGRLDMSQFSVAQLLELSREALAPYTLTTTPEQVEWWTVYVVGQRVASQFALHERAFIVGDACHTHSPKAGQGMNTSISDSHNLAWKLALAVKGYASLELLKTYEFERRAVAQELIGFDKWFAEGFSSRARAKVVEGNGDVLPGPLEAWRTFGAFTTGIGIKYAPSVITMERPGDKALCTLELGKRVPSQQVVRVADSSPIDIQDTLPSDGRFKLLVFPGDVSSADHLKQLHETALKLHDVLSKYSTDIINIVTVAKEFSSDLNYMDVPSTLRHSWRSVLMEGASGAVPRVYKSYGIAEGGLAVMVRPDGCIGAIMRLQDIQEVASYFSRFLVHSR